MKVLFACLLAISSAFLLPGCHNRGSSAPPPTDVVVTPGDGVVTVTWTMSPGVDYWLFYGAGTSITTDNWFTLPGAGVIRNATSPYVLAGLTNGTTYSFTINGRIKNGPGGPGSPSVSAIPRLAGATWVNGTALTVPSPGGLNGVTYGSGFVTVGDGGYIASSADGKTWTPQSSGGITSNLNAVAYGGGYVAIGAGGVVLQSSDAINWTNPVSSTSNDLYGVTAVGSFFVAVGANGTIATSSGGTTWTVQTSGTLNALYGVTYGNGKYIAVGANGTVLTSTDAVTWQAATVLPSAPSATLRSVAYGNGIYVALGDTGTFLTSSDGLTWTQQTAFSGSTINAVIYATQFIAVGSGGAIYTNVDGGNSNWISVAPAPAALNGLAHGNYGYVAVGVSGTNLTAY